MRDEPVYADRLLVVSRTSKPAGLRFAGEIDMTNAQAITDALRIAFSEPGDAHLDLRALIFCDISGIRALVDAAHGLAPRRLQLHGLPAQLESVFRVTGWCEMPGLSLCGCEAA
jgi:anti-anti-sigma factor